MLSFYNSFVQCVDSEETSFRLSLDNSIAEIRRAANRDEVLIALLRGAATLMEQPQIYKVQSESIEGYCTWVDGQLDREKIRQQELPIDAYSIACRVAETGIAHFGPLLVNDPVGPLVDEGRVTKDAVLVQPIKLQSKTACLLIGIVRQDKKLGAVVDATARLAGQASHALLKMIVQSRWSLEGKELLMLSNHDNEISCNTDVIVMEADLPPAELQLTMSNISIENDETEEINNSEMHALVQRISALKPSSSGNVIYLLKDKKASESEEELDFSETNYSSDIHLPSWGRAIPSYSVRQLPLQINLDQSSDHNIFVGFSGSVDDCGIFVATDTEGEIGERFEIRFTVPGLYKVIETVGEVVWTRPYNPDNPSITAGLGLKLLSLAPAAKEAIEYFISEREPIFFE